MYPNRNEIDILVSSKQHYRSNRLRRTKRRICLQVFIPFVVVLMTTTSSSTTTTTTASTTIRNSHSKSLPQLTAHQQLTPIFRVGNHKNNINLRFCIDYDDDLTQHGEDSSSGVGCTTGLPLQQQQQQEEEEEQTDYGTHRTSTNNNIVIPHGGGTSSTSISSSSGSTGNNPSKQDIHDANNDGTGSNNPNDLTTVSHQILQEFHTEVQQIMKMNLITIQQLVTNVTNEIRFIKDEQRRISLVQQQQQQGTSTKTDTDNLDSTGTRMDDSAVIIDSESDSSSSTIAFEDKSINDPIVEEIPLDAQNAQIGNTPSMDDSTNDTIITSFTDTTSIHVDEGIDKDIDSCITEPAKVTPTENYNFDDDDDYLDLDTPIATSTASISSTTTTKITANGKNIDIVDDVHHNTNDAPKKRTKVVKKMKRKNNNMIHSNKSKINTPTVLKPKNKNVPFIPTSTITDVNGDDNNLSEIELVNHNNEPENEIDETQQLPTTTEVLHRSLQKLVKSIITSVLFCFVYVILKRFVHILLRGLGVQLQSSSSIMDPTKQRDGSTANTILAKP
jgi:hypothetical protein